jgi:hypothetical protein
MFSLPSPRLALIFLVTQTLDSTRRSSAHAAAVGGSIGGAFTLLFLGLYIFISYQHKIEAKHPLSSHPTGS